jgi:hypothetical protein
MKKVILIILTITSLTVSGQNHLFGVKGGVNITNDKFDDDPIHIETKNTISYIRGLTYEYLLNKHFSIGGRVIIRTAGMEC